MRPHTATRMGLLAAGLSALALLAACDGDSSVRITSSSSGGGPLGVLKVVESLQCPDTMGELTRKGSAQADGRACTYTGPRGTEVQLHLVALGDRDAAAVLRRFETELGAAMPATLARIGADAARDAAQAQADRAQATADTAAATAETAAAAAQATGETTDISAPGMRIQTQDDRASVHMPGIHIEANGDKADVRIAGFTISADGDAATVNGQVPGATGGSTGGSGPAAGTGDAVSVVARDQSAQVRTRAPGEATRQTYMLTDDAPSPAGWRMVGYEARGPRGGPIVVATIRAKDRRTDSAFDDVKALVSLNVGD